MLRLILPLLFLAIQSALVISWDANICGQKIEKGRCLAYMERYAYNITSGQCEKFIYGGCEGNENNFLSLEKCQEVCHDDCTLELEKGPCKGHLARYYYNKETRTCEKFIYGGCGGNKNNFQSLDKCRKLCYKECTLPKDIGRCKASIQRYYYNEETSKCEAFIYGGCGGNANNFVSEKDCEARCVITNTPE